MEGKCCKCEEYDWDDPQKVVWSDETGSYCLMHSPADKKFKSLNGDKCSTPEFNKCIFSIIAAHNERYDCNDTICNLSGTIFPGAIWFSRYFKDVTLPSLDFSDSEFHGTCSVRNLKFGGEIWFSSVLFKSEAQFQNCVFMKAAWFSSANFSKIASFYKTIFYEHVAFEHTTFTDTVFFLLTHFVGQAEFNWTTFTTEARFSSAIFDSPFIVYNCIANTKAVQLNKIHARSLANINCLPATLSLFSFVDCRWPDRLNIETTLGNGHANFFAAEEFYRAMKQRAAEAHDQPLVSP